MSDCVLWITLWEFSVDKFVNKMPKPLPFCIGICDILKRCDSGSEKKLIKKYRPSDLYNFYYMNLKILRLIFI